MVKNYEWASLVTIYRTTKILDVDFSIPPTSEDNNGQQEEEGEEWCGLLEGVNIRIPPKTTVMAPKDEFVPCSTLLLCLNDQCDVDVFTAVNESGLVYDGGVVVNEVTNHPSLSSEYHSLMFSLLSLSEFPNCGSLHLCCRSLQSLLKEV
jgi:hypothetical protein